MVWRTDRTLGCCKPRFSPQTSKYNSAALDRMCPRSNACSPPEQKQWQAIHENSKPTQWAVKEWTGYFNLLTFLQGLTHCTSFQQPNSLQSCLVTLISLVMLITGPFTLLDCTWVFDLNPTLLPNHPALLLDLAHRQRSPPALAPPTALGQPPHHGLWKNRNELCLPSLSRKRKVSQRMKNMTNTSNQRHTLYTNVCHTCIHA